MNIYKENGILTIDMAGSLIINHSSVRSAINIDHNVTVGVKNFNITGKKDGFLHKLKFCFWCVVYVFQN